MGQGILKDLGPCEVAFDGIKVGETFGDVTFRYAEEGVEIIEDSKGICPVDEVLIGAKCEVEVPITRFTLAELAAVMPGATLIGNKLEIDSPVGQSLYDNAKELVLKPLVGGVVSANTSWLTIPHAAARMDAEIVYNNSGQRIYKAIFKGFADITTGLIWYIGS